MRPLGSSATPAYTKRKNTLEMIGNTIETTFNTKNQQDKKSSQTNQTLNLAFLKKLEITRLIRDSETSTENIPIEKNKNDKLSDLPQISETVFSHVAHPATKKALQPNTSSPAPNSNPFAPHYMFFSPSPMHYKMIPTLSH